MEGRAEKPHYHGHRARLRRRFLAGGADALADYELLELLLFQALPRGDAKPLAKRLLAHFDDDFAEVIGAPADRLRAVEGVGEAVVAALKTAEAVALRPMRERMRARDVVSSWRDLLAYCRARIAGAAREQFHILFLDSRNQIIADEQQQTGTVDHAPVYPREVIKRALEHGASAIILVHNHSDLLSLPLSSDAWSAREIASALTYRRPRNS